jgi:hypothetical protein
LNFYDRNLYSIHPLNELEEGEMPFCRNCGWEYGEEHAFCKNCGQVLTKPLLKEDHEEAPIIEKEEPRRIEEPTESPVTEKPKEKKVGELEEEKPAGEIPGTQKEESTEISAIGRKQTIRKPIKKEVRASPLIIILILIGVGIVGATRVPLLEKEFSHTEKVPYTVQVPYTERVPYQVRIPYTEWERKNLFDGTIKVNAGTYYDIRGTFTKGAFVAGTFRSSDTINFFFFDDLNYNNWKSNSGSSALHVSNQKISDTFDEEIPRAGNYHLVFDNRFSIITPKTVAVKIDGRKPIIKYRTETRYRDETRYRNETRYREEARSTTKKVSLLEYLRS